MEIDFIFQILILIFSVVVHEVAHGLAANYLGDTTAKYQGRLTLNPLKHLDPFNSFILPLVTYFSFGFIFGMAKPVEINPNNINARKVGLPLKYGEALVAFAGPLSNLCIALFFGLILRFGVLNVLGEAFLQMSVLIVFINLVLAIFNLVPIPPLDGSKILFSILPYSMNNVRNLLEQYGIYLMIIFVFFLWRLILPVVFLMFSLITGLSF